MSLFEIISSVDHEVCITSSISIELGKFRRYVSARVKDVGVIFRHASGKNATAAEIF